MAKKQEQDPHRLTAKEARALLDTHKEKNKLRVHTIEGMGPIMMGCNVDLKIIMERLKQIESTEPDQIRLAGPNMTGVGHGIGYWKNDKVGYEFLQTDKTKLEAHYKKVGLEFPSKK